MRAVITGRNGLIHHTDSQNHPSKNLHNYIWKAYWNNYLWWAGCWVVGGPGSIKPTHNCAARKYSLTKINLHSNISHHLCLVKFKKQGFILFTGGEFDLILCESSNTEAVYWNLYQTFALLKSFLTLTWMQYLRLPVCLISDDLHSEEQMMKLNLEWAVLLHGGVHSYPENASICSH